MNEWDPTVPAPKRRETTSVEPKNEEPTTSKERSANFFKAHYRGIIIVVVPLLLLPLLFLKPRKEMHCLYTVVIMAIWWITEVIPLYYTSCIPILVFPLMGILDSEQVAFYYFKDALMLFFAGLLVALAIEYSNLHKRVALSVILVVGCSPRRLHVSLSVVTCFISMWISNSAATALMCPIIKAVLEELAAQNVLEMYHPDSVNKPDQKPTPSRCALAFYFSAAYASSIGGCGTLIGTGTNVTFQGIYDTRFPKAQDIDFMKFMFFGAPLMVVHLVLTILWLQIIYMGLFRPNSTDAKNAVLTQEGEATAKEVIRTRIKELGRFSCHELQVSIIFIVMIIMLVFRRPGFVTGWADVLNEKVVKNSMPITLAGFLLLVLPIHYYFFYYCCCKRSPDQRETPSLLSWDFVHQNLPWGLLFLVGGGFALAAGLTESGLAVLLGKNLRFMEIFDPPVVQLFVIIASIILTAFSSNVAMCNICMPVFLEMAVAIKVHPGYIGLPSCLLLSFAFHFPVSTPPNAIIAGVANVKTKDMAFAGIGPSLICIVCVFIFMQTWARVIYPGFNEFPDWAV